MKNCILSNSSKGFIYTAQPCCNIIHQTVFIKILSTDPHRSLIRVRYVVSIMRAMFDPLSYLSHYMAVCNRVIPLHNTPFSQNTCQIHSIIRRLDAKESYVSLALNHWYPLIYQTDEVLSVLDCEFKIYCQIWNIKCTKSQNSNVSRLVLQLSLHNPLKPDVKLRMKVLQIHLSDQQFNCPLSYRLY